LPRLVPLGDVEDEDLDLVDDGIKGDFAVEAAPAMPELERRLLLAQLVRRWEDAGAADPTGERIGDERALALAGELARLIDQVETEELDFGRLADLVPERYAEHWQQTLAFLTIVTEWWPAIEADRGTIGPARRHAMAVRRRIEAWRRQPCPNPVIVAGSTGSIPATRALIEAVLALPQGVVVLPGLDRVSDDELWSQILADSTHPQFGLASLLHHIGRGRDAVALWPEGTVEAGKALRARLVETALVPAEGSQRWRALSDAFPQQDAARALASITRIDCADPGEEGRTIALLMREILETPERTATLVTPDRALARRVAAELRRWRVEVDDSAGLPLDKTTPGSFLLQLAQVVAGGFAPLDLLALLKHPLAAGGQPPEDFQRLARRLEIAALRGVRPTPGLDGIERVLRDGETTVELQAWLSELSRRLRPFVSKMGEARAPLSALLRDHVAAAEALAERADESGAEAIWRDEAGEALAAFFAEIASLRASMSIAPASYPALLRGLMEGRVVRPRYGRHPRLAILGPLEARLQRLDRVILGGLNEGTWPTPSDPGPWLSRPMRADFGLPSPERRIGLAAHDFLQAFSADEVFLTRAQRDEGSPSVPSRWLLRLDAFVDLLGLEMPTAAQATRWRGWAARLDRPQDLRPSPPPEPRPPIEARPRSLSVTRIETWFRDPYGLYADKILDLRALEPIDADPTLADRGTLIHSALERLVAAFPQDRPADVEGRLIEIGRELFRDVADRPGLWAFWWPRFQRIAHWVAEQEASERGRIARSWAEAAGRLVLALPSGDFTLTAKADRIDRLVEEGFRIIDYKTGGLPSMTEVERGPAFQLPLEAAILQGGGFEALPGGKVRELAFWRLSGGREPGQSKSVPGEPSELAERALEALATMVEAFSREETPYASMPRPALAPRYSDYHHLARSREWTGPPGEEET
jgi:ATP-dependent helicase/nuclease subunit B